MSVIVSVSTLEGEVGRCDARCYNAKHPYCLCVCGGANHGIGKEEAAKKARDNWKDWGRLYANEKGLTDFYVESDDETYYETYGYRSDKEYNLRVGSKVYAKADTAICKKGEWGVVVNVYDRDSTVGGRHKGYGILFARGEYDGFSPEEIERFVESIGEVDEIIEDYEFQSVIKLMDDYREGRFRSSLEHATMVQPPREGDKL